MRRTISVLMILSFACWAYSDLAFVKKYPPKWKPVADDVYLQEAGEQIKTDQPILSIAAYQDSVYATTPSGFFMISDGKLTKEETPFDSAQKLFVLQDSLWALADSGLFRLSQNEWKKIADTKINDLCVHLDQIHAVGNGQLYHLENDALVPVEGGSGAGTILNIASYAETLYCLQPGRLVLFNNGQFEDETVIDFGTFPSRTLRGLFVDGSRMLIPTDKGLSVLRGMTLTTITGKEGLCYEDTTCLANGFDGDLWIGTTYGAIRNTNGQYHYFANQRWMPGNSVNGIAVKDHSVFIATDKGVGIIHYEPYTLQKKAAFYERHLEEWGQKRLGFVHKIEWDASLNEWVREVSDNDGGWSIHYLTAMSFKYAVTGDEEARKEAVDCFYAMKWLDDITPIKGYPARAIWQVGEKGHKSMGTSGCCPAEWHATADGVWEWKADTSSDEIDAHYYGIPIFHELAAKGKEKEDAKKFMTDMMDHIIDNGWLLRDMDGLPTVWGRWDPPYLQTPVGMYARGLNGLEILGFVRTTIAFSDDQKYQDGLQQLLDWGYAKEALRQKLTFPPGDINHSDDRLAFFVYHSLLRYEHVPELRSIYMRSLERSWEIERLEHIPWFNFIYGAMTGNDCEPDKAVAHLREWPLDLVSYSFRNSHRHDLYTPPGYVAQVGGTKAMSPREISPDYYAAPTLRYDGGAGGHAVLEPSQWIESYWMGRYYGFIEPPATKDKNLLTVEKRNLQLGAEPYNGPERPKYE